MQVGIGVVVVVLPAEVQLWHHDDGATDPGHPAIEPARPERREMGALVLRCEQVHEDDTEQQHRRPDQPAVRRCSHQCASGKQRQPVGDQLPGGMPVVAGHQRLHRLARQHRTHQFGRRDTTRLIILHRCTLLDAIALRSILRDP